MSIHVVNLIDRKDKRKFVILKGQRDTFKKMVQARLYIIGSLAYAEWEQAALNRWKDASTGWRYIEGLYWEPLGSTVNIGVKERSFGALLENGWEELNFLSSFKTKAVLRGGKLIVPFGGSREYFSPAKARQKIPTSESYGALLQKHEDNPGIVLNKVIGVMQTRQIASAAMSTKPLGVFIRTSPPDSYRTVTVTTPSNLWKAKEYRGAMIAHQVASTVERLGRQFMGDLWPEVSTIDI